MRKTSIYIEDEIDVALSRKAAESGTTKAALIREALRAAAGDAVRVKPKAKGIFEGPGDLSERVDEYLEETGFGST